MTPVRALFANGAVLGAPDLTAVVDGDRDRSARHARHLHTAGIGAGLDLLTQENATAAGAAYVDVTVASGYAIDEAGRELVLAAPLALSPEQFAQDVPHPPLEPGETFSVWHPVFLRGVDAPVPAAAGPRGCGSTREPARMEERVEVEFGAPGDDTVVTAPPPPDAGPVLGPWRVLLGFVRFDPGIARFHAAAVAPPGLRPPRAGVRAEVVAGSARVELRPAPAAAAGGTALVLDGAAGTLVYGTYDAAGAVTPALTVDAAGNVDTKGTVRALRTSGGVLVAAGTAFDGVVLPLPAGADPAQISAGAAELSVTLVPRPPGRDGAPTPAHRFLFAECRVDADRRVRCWGTWFNPTGAGAPQDRTASCDYLVLVAVPASAP